MKKLLTLIFVALAFVSQAQPIQADPNVIIGEDNTYADYWTLTAQSDRLDIDATGIASPGIRLVDFVGPKLIFVDADGDLILINDGTAGQALTTNGSGTYSFNTVTTVPAGSDTQFQFNNGGAFGGDSGMTTNGSGSVDISGDLDVDNVNIDGNIILGSGASTDTGLTLSSSITTDTGTNPAILVKASISGGTDVSVRPVFSLYNNLSELFTIESDGDHDLNTGDLRDVGQIFVGAYASNSASEFSSISSTAITKNVASEGYISIQQGGTPTSYSGAKLVGGTYTGSTDVPLAIESTLTNNGDDSGTNPMMVFSVANDDGGTLGTRQISARPLYRWTNDYTTTIAEISASGDWDFQGNSLTNFSFSGTTFDLTDNTLTGTITEFNTALSGEDFATLTGTETLSNKTLTAPKIANAGFIADANGNEQIIFNTTASAVNEITVTNAATGSGPTISATGGDTNVNLNLLPKGTGVISSKTAMSDASTRTIFEIGDDTSPHFGTISYRKEASGDDGYLAIAGKSGGTTLNIFGSGNMNTSNTSFSINYATLGLRQNVDGSPALVTEKNTTSNTNHALFWNPNGSVGSISTSGTSTSFNTSSDYRLKTDFQDFDAISIAKSIQVYNYKWTADSTRAYGVKAHELQSIISYAVTGYKDEVDSKGNPVMQGVDYSKLVPILLKAIQQLESRIEALENK